MKTEHRADIEHVTGGSRAACPCDYEGRVRQETELAIHDAEQHVRYEQDRPALRAAAGAGSGEGA